MTVTLASGHAVDLAELYRQYESELRRVSRCLRIQYHRMRSQGHDAAFGDVDGEVLYLLLRAAKPERVFEISPNAGWSTNYILAALTANGSGTVHSFELKHKIGRAPTESVIRGNQWTDWDQSRLVVHLGDARRLTVEVQGPIEFLLLDSCHQAAFARWYIEQLFPRVQGTAFIQDIASVDRLEISGEARELWQWAQQHGVSLRLVGAVERELARAGLRRGLAERWPLRSNSVLLTLPHADQGPAGDPVRMPREPSELIAAALACGDQEAADNLLNQLVTDLLWSPNVPHRHRDFFYAAGVYRALGNPGEAARCLERALGVVLGSEPRQRGKGLVELLRMYSRARQWRLSGSTFALTVFDPYARRQLIRKGAQRFMRRKRASHPVDDTSREAR